MALAPLLGILPHWSFGPWEIAGPLAIHSFGLSVAVGLVLCFGLASWRTERKLGAPAEDVQNLGFYLVFIGWALSHVFNVILYEPEALLRDPLILFKVWTSISSYGGLMGGFIAFFIWHWRHPQYDRLAFMDLGAWSLPVPWFFGRIGCATVHDHPGHVATEGWLGHLWADIQATFPSLPEIFPLAIQFDPTKSPGVAGPRHDLGLYEAIWWAVLVFAVLWLDRKPRPSGFYLAVLPLLYAPARFLLDFLRVPPELGGDARYFGMTPAQYLSIVIFVAGLIYLPIVLRRPPMPWVRYQPPAPEPESEAVHEERLPAADKRPGTRTRRKR